MLESFDGDRCKVLTVIGVKGAELIGEFQRRQLLAQMTSGDELIAHLDAPRTIYCGFDPTADSLHIGSLVPLLALRRLQRAGHKPIALVGGATGLIGDPSHKAEERQLNTAEVVGEWVERLRAQVSQFIDFDGGANAAVVVNNLDWMDGISALDFLRDVGKHFSVNAMVQKESVKQRIDREGAGISFTEFSYLLLQSYDFAELYKRHGCSVQLGGSDQWGNITGGIDLTRRMHQAQVFGMTLPLVTKADGTKFGKTESGTIWLDPEKTSPYAFYQFWINSADADVYKFLRYFTFMDCDEIEEVERVDAERQGRPEAQALLASTVTELVHGAEGLRAAQRISTAMFSGEVHTLSADDFKQLHQDGLPTSELPGANLAEIPLTTLLVDAGVAKSGKQIKDALAREAVWINGKSVTASQNMACAELFAASEALSGRYFVVKLGKKNYHLLVR